jgi:hypothetical protein
MAAIVFATKVIKKINYNKTPPIFSYINKLARKTANITGGNYQLN